MAPAAAVTLSNGAFEGSIFAASLSVSEPRDFDLCGYGQRISNTVDPLPALSEGLPIAMGGLALLGFAGLLVQRRRRRGRAARAHPAHRLIPYGGRVVKGGISADTRSSS